LAEDAKVRIHPDNGARQITISDMGIGMSRDELVQNLGTIARSGTRAFGQSLADAKPEERPALIGQFGVGFYAAFMVADRVEVTSRRAGSDEAWRWASEGAGSYTLSPAQRDLAGTDIVLHIKSDADEFLEPFRLETIIRKWADHITLPVTIVRDGGEESAANDGTALWRKPKNDITEDAYAEFYRHVAHAFDKPWATLHWKAEGAIEFSALLFVPGMKPFEAVESARESKVRLHVRRMFITDDANLLPPWLRFVHGVVDTEDLPLNVSREMLQTTPVLARIRKAVTNRVLTELRNRAKDPESYAKFWSNFGGVLKEGLWEDAEHRTEVATLARFHSTQSSDLTALADYVARMKPEQDAIYFLSGDSIDALRDSAQLEGFRARGVEVLLLADPVDAFWPERLDSFEGKKLVSVTQGHADLSKLPVGDEEAALPEPADVSSLIDQLKATLGDAVADIRTTDRLVGSAVVLAAGDAGPDLQMMRLMRRSGQRLPAPPPILEINPRHRLIQALAAHPGDLAEAGALLLDLARLQDGEVPANPAAFSRRFADIMVAALAAAPAD
jgi:molecular chaperone HtpG